MDPEKVKTFWDWLNINDLALARWSVRGSAEDHEHFLEELTPEETEAVLERYLRNVRKIYGDPKAKKVR